ncbi:HAM group protein, partial [Reticulomyxa filosa]
EEKKKILYSLGKFFICLNFFGLIIIHFAREESDFVFPNFTLLFRFVLPFLTFLLELFQVQTKMSSVVTEKDICTVCMEEIEPSKMSVTPCGHKTMYLSSGPEDNEEESSGFPSDFDTDTVVEFVAHGTEMKEEKKEADDNPETLLLGTVASEIIIISDDEEKEVKIKEEENDADDEEEEEEETESESEETMEPSLELDVGGPAVVEKKVEEKIP